MRAAWPPSALCLQLTFRHLLPDMRSGPSSKRLRATSPWCGCTYPWESLRRAGARWPCAAPLLLAHAVTRDRYDLLLYLLGPSKNEIEGTRMSIDFFVDPEADEPYAGEVSVGCGGMPKVPPRTHSPCALAVI